VSIRNIKASAKASTLVGLIPCYDKYLIERAKQDTSHRDGYLHPSFLSGCMTNAALTLLGFELPASVADARALRIFALGHAIHRVIQQDFIQAGFIEVINGVRQVEVPLSIPAINLVGHADGIIAEGAIPGVPRAVLEIKSINSNAFRGLKEPKPEHKIQAGAYAEALGIEYVLFVYYAKDTSDLAAFLHRVTPRDRSEVFRRATEIQGKVTSWKERQEFPAPCFDASSKPPCSWCVWQRVCHSTFEREAYITRMKESTDAPQKATQGKAVKKPPRRLLRNIRGSAG
jgi:hypothetical protein